MICSHRLICFPVEVTRTNKSKQFPQINKVHYYIQTPLPNKPGRLCLSYNHYTCRSGPTSLGCANVICALKKEQTTVGLIFNLRLLSYTSLILLKNNFLNYIMQGTKALWEILVQLMRHRLLATTNTNISCLKGWPFHQFYECPWMFYQCSPSIKWKGSPSAYHRGFQCQGLCRRNNILHKTAPLAIKTTYAAWAENGA